MFRLLGTLIAFVGLLLGATQTAVAHGRANNHYDAPHHYRVSAYRDASMPRWLQRERNFSGWYQHSSLRHNHHLQWWQLYEIYLWERRYDRRHRHQAYNSKHSYDWYRRYWRDYDRQRQNNRYENRHDNRRDARRRHYSDD
jgi:hypothetical protein